jgi:hypothetical protein
MKKLLSILTAFVLAFSLVACGDSDNEESQEIYKTGDVLVIDDIEFEVLSITTEEEVGNEFLNTTANGIFLIVELEITNNGSDSITVDTNNFTLINDDVRFDADTLASMYVNDDVDFFLTNLNPTTSLTGFVVFDLSEDMANSEDNILEVSTTWIGGSTGEIALID